MNLPLAGFRTHLEDFEVHELPAYAPSGEGEHLFVGLKKRDLTTLEAMRLLCAAMEVDPRGAGFAGMKDKRGITTQTISLPYPLKRNPADALALRFEKMTILFAERHGNKLKPGHLQGNRFSVVLRDLPPERLDELSHSFRSLASSGVPNTFGPQRFGRDGDNPTRALQWLLGNERGPRDKREQRLLFSALQSHLFNQVLERREEDGTWNVPLAGDLLKKTDTGGLFSCTEPETEKLRCAQGEVSPTGPIFGVKMRWPSGEPERVEREVLRACAEAENIFERNARLGEGSRRPFVLPVSEIKTSAIFEETGALRLEFVLPKGGYATTVLARSFTLREPPRVGDAALPNLSLPIDEAQATSSHDESLTEDMSG